PMIDEEGELLHNLRVDLVEQISMGWIMGFWLHEVEAQTPVYQLDNVWRFIGRRRDFEKIPPRGLQRALTMLVLGIIVEGRIQNARPLRMPIDLPWSALPETLICGV